jgi:hypothetical protein
MLSIMRFAARREVLMVMVMMLRKCLAYRAVGKNDALCKA